jgi:hypothetical protein
MSGFIRSLLKNTPFFKKTHKKSPPTNPTPSVQVNPLEKIVPARQINNYPIRRRSALKQNGRPKKTVKTTFDSPKNRTYKYYLYDNEKQAKRGSPPKRGPSCKDDESAVFPCVYRGVLFDTKEEWDEYKSMKNDKNQITGYKTIKEHHIETMKNLREESKQKDEKTPVYI